ncbi:hypothetical protein GGQ88_003509 [Novosphingobium hassiacum]|uniref:Uncharacterized protein n=1 Tax=Novosphingobium hassiacum TaxID=173676 RepID=A0A7W5ZZ68_9SPHN|nr:hypothetical protein [Novosphingobium hassiacum]MBB3862211.1 hypothetical protein [Novosphingobium hassiacum]
MVPLVIHQHGPCPARRTDAMMLDYVLRMRDAWGDCRAKLAGVRAWADALGD